jgi:hypothetical protein
VQPFRLQRGGTHTHAHTHTHGIPKPLFHIQGVLKMFKSVWISRSNFDRHRTSPPLLRTREIKKIDDNVLQRTTLGLWQDGCSEVRRAELLSFIHQWLYSPLFGPGLFFSFVIIFTQMVRLLGRGISPSQGRNLYTEYKHRINAHTDIHALSGIRNHDPRFEWAKTVLALGRAATLIGEYLAISKSSD